MSSSNDIEVNHHGIANLIETKRSKTLSLMIMSSFIYFEGMSDKSHKKLKKLYVFFVNVKTVTIDIYLFNKPGLLTFCLEEYKWCINICNSVEMFSDQ